MVRFAQTAASTPQMVGAIAEIEIGCRKGGAKSAVRHDLDHALEIRPTIDTLNQASQSDAEANNRTGGDVGTEQRIRPRTRSRPVSQRRYVVTMYDAPSSVSFMSELPNPPSNANDSTR